MGLPYQSVTCRVHGIFAVCSRNTVGKEYLPHSGPPNIESYVREETRGLHVATLGNSVQYGSFPDLDPAWGPPLRRSSCGRDWATEVGVIRENTGTRPVFSRMTHLTDDAPVFPRMTPTSVAQFPHTTVPRGWSPLVPSLYSDLPHEAIPFCPSHENVLLAMTARRE